MEKLGYWWSTFEFIVVSEKMAIARVVGHLTKGRLVCFGIRLLTEMFLK